MGKNQVLKRVSPQL